MRGRPMAATRMSASRHTDARSRVLEWQIVTVASALVSISASGRPTIALRPTTTARLPLSATPLRRSSSMQPSGVPGATTAGCPSARRPKLYG